MDAAENQILSGETFVWREPLLQNVCNGNIRGKGVSNSTSIQAKCHFLHHFNRYLAVGPFKLEIQLYEPFRSIFHEFFAETELDWIINFTRPRLFASRIMAAKEKTKQFDISDKIIRLRSATVGFTDVIFNENYIYKKISAEPLHYEILPLQDPYGYKVISKLMFKVSRRIELVTHLNVTSRNGATKFQSTNYGLSGMAAMHIDPWGYEKGVPIVEGKKSLVHTGDYMATFMGWIEDTASGGGTAFTDKGFEGTLMPTKGSAGFWFNMLTCHTKDDRTWHAGCPVLKGSKWILNKWVYSYSQWKNWPCLLKRRESIPAFEGISF